MAEIINLNKKERLRFVQKRKKASENRIKFGRTKKEKLVEKQENDRNKRHLDSHKLEQKEEE